MTDDTEARRAGAAAALRQAGPGGAPRTWLLVSDKLGDNAQLRRVVEALGWPAETKRLVFRERYRFGKPRFGASLHHLAAGASHLLEPPWPDLVITIGRRPAMVALWIRQQAQGRTRIVLLGRPKRWLERFDLVVAPSQYIVPEHPNVLPIDIPLMDVDRRRLAVAKEQWRTELAALPRPLTALLVGGATKPYRLDASAARELLRAVSASCRGGGLYVTTSRRTSAQAAAALAGSLPPDARLFAWSAGEQRNPYHALLAHADRLVVTGDSVSMIVEGVRVGKPLAIYALPVHSPRRMRLQRRLEQALWLSGRPAAQLGVALVNLGLLGFPRHLERLHRRLFETGLAVPFGEPFAAPARPAPDELGRVADRIAALMGCARSTSSRSSAP